MLENPENQLNEMLCSNLVKCLKNSVIVALVLVSYATIASARTDQIAKNSINTEKSAPNNPNTTTTNMKKVPFVEYYIEHNINEGEAKRSFFETGIKTLDGMCDAMICICVFVLVLSFCLIFIKDTKTVSYVRNK